jgi:aqualysin 1
MAYPTLTTQSPATWGIDRVDQRNRPLDNKYSYNFTGLGVRAYVIDSGIDYNHPQFEGRAFNSKDYVNDGETDCNSHGTHVAGTIGSRTYGIAKQVGLYSVRVFPCSGGASYTTIIAAVDHVTAEKISNSGIPMVANMSLGGGVSSSLNNAVTNSINKGVVYAVSAGNSNANACNYSPASTPAALTVGSTTSSDARSSFSNYGTCVDLFAPGSSILSTVPGGGTGTKSGTSMSAPHVAGVAALVLQANPTASAAQINQAIVDNATSGVLSSIGTGSPNKLLYSLIGDPPPPPTNQAPKADFTFTTSDLTASFTDTELGLRRHDRVVVLEFRRR